jgi:hypothetical protein
MAQYIICRFFDAANSYLSPGAPLTMATPAPETSRGLYTIVRHIKDVRFLLGKKQ